MSKEIMTIGIAADHAGYELKETVIAHLKAKGYAVTNFGTDSTDSCDYPDYAHPLAQAVCDGSVDRGISICGSGNGISMVLNKYDGVRAALCWDDELVALARQHNDANVLSLPARFISRDKGLEMVDIFLLTDFEGGRHQRRVDKIAPQR
ncbi:ribose 5-phosphate isomerase B [Porphyromonas sp.]|uniref:ribose 5-phosphate isomerase B n=1 Tax=Porphyromonas sp. TaxID=1924944 RepID=UPI0026DBC534|nr:ribose 5-phosphate isomerase B [Porphyromonas sp.]MDO4695390.1 ribose 5-phosphate isomerase B [Porphyromonas sp.]MDO4770483.1 ribose 5-phosphate isomerase B [Porphyromonas sp.]